MKDVMEWCQYYVTLPYHGDMSSVSIMHYITVLCIYVHKINPYPANMENTVS
jgi:hypothetical protein